MPEVNAAANAISFHKSRFLLSKKAPQTYLVNLQAVRQCRRSYKYLHMF